MLQHLSIRNIVLIESCDIHFAHGLCVLTGETGAGKSILLDALGLALGARFETRLIRHGETNASVSAAFDITQASAAKLTMLELGLEAEDTLILRRQLSSDGKSRCFVNDAPVSVGTLRALGECLLEIHGQHEQRGLLDPARHVQLLDAFGALETEASSTEQAFVAWKEAVKALATLHEHIAQAEKEEAYLRHMETELRELAPQAGEEEQLASTRTTMMQGEKLATLLQDVEKELMGIKPVDAALATAERMLTRSALQADGRFSPMIESLERAGNEVAEVFSHLQSLRQQTLYDPTALERLEDRLFALRAAARKYGTEVDGLEALLNETQSKLGTLSSQQSSIAHLAAAVSDAEAAYVKVADILSLKRKKAAEKLEKTITSELVPLKMGNVKFRVAFTPLAQAAWSARGMESVQFEAATNITSSKDIPYAPLTKIASGGELSRFMLAMKVALAEVNSTPTFIFVEIDTGTGGAVAEAIGQRLAKLGKTAQVLVVTHLPQVAAQGGQHLRIEKRQTKNAISTHVEVLNTSERKEELARMLAGADVTNEARDAAAKLLKAAG